MSTPTSLAATAPKCAICYDIYDQELARAFTASCGHSICAQCEFKLRLSCIKRGIPPQCWICIKPFNGPLYRTFALESSIPRTEKQPFPNPYMSDAEIRQDLVTNPRLYRDTSIEDYTPPYRPTIFEDHPPPYRPTVLSPQPQNSGYIGNPHFDPLPFYQQLYHVPAVATAVVSYINPIDQPQQPHGAVPYCYGYYPAIFNPAWLQHQPNPNGSSGPQ
uniref:RING-type domain-containing protein n=1 Tax=Panagrolaimus sp. ES5 TaxID=591445 RepID=A0AC34F4S5_9BILA